MSYSTNPQLVVERMHDLLELKAGRACRWRVNPATPHQTKLHAYRMREALNIASKYPHMFPELARAYEAFEIWYIEPGLVEARPAAASNVVAGITNRTTEPARSMAPTVGLWQAEDVIEAWRRSQPTNDPINFQSTKLDTAELTKLWNFFQEDARTNSMEHPRWMVLVGDSHITLTPWQEEVDKYSWKPAAQPTPEEQFDV